MLLSLSSCFVALIQKFFSLQAAGTWPRARAVRLSFRHTVAWLNPLYYI